MVILSKSGIVKNNQDNINISLFEAFGNLTIFCLKYFLKRKKENKICPFGSDLVWEKIKRKNSSSTMRLLTNFQVNCDNQRVIDSNFKLDIFQTEVWNKETSRILFYWFYYSLRYLSEP